MADYYPLVAKAIAGLEKNTGEGRRTLYERARTALVAQLRGMNDPPLTEAEITRERLALEEAIRKVEAEAARRGREVPRAERSPKLDAGSDASQSAPAKPAVPERPATPPRPRTPSRTVTDEGLKGFRDVIAEAEALGDATAQGAKTAREAFAATPPSGDATFNRVEPRVEPEGLRTPLRPPSRPIEQPARDAAPNPFEAHAPEPRASPRTPELDRPVEPRPGQQRQSPMRQPAADDIGELPKHSRVRLIAAIVTVLLILALGAAAYWQRDRIAGLVAGVRGTAIQQPKDAAAIKPKIT